jgi:hypothetical protein
MTTVRQLPYSWMLSLAKFGATVGTAVHELAHRRGRRRTLNHSNRRRIVNRRNLHAVAPSPNFRARLRNSRTYERWPFLESGLPNNSENWYHSR